VVCDDNYEDVARIFSVCPLSIQAWRAIGLWEKVETIVHTIETVTTDVFMLLQQLDVHQTARMASLMWSIWKHKNLKLWQNVSAMSTQVIDRAIQLIKGWEHAKLVRQKQQSRGSPSGSNNVSYSRNDDSGSSNNDQGSNTVVAPASRSNQGYQNRDFTLTLFA
jgi:hypothetical protein